MVGPLRETLILPTHVADGRHSSVDHKLREHVCEVSVGFPGISKGGVIVGDVDAAAVAHAFYEPHSVGDNEVVLVFKVDTLGGVSEERYE